MKKQLEIKKIAIWMDHKEAKMIDPAHLDQDLIKVTSKIKGRKRISGQSSDGVKLGGFRSSNNEFAKQVIHTVDGDYITDNQLKAFVKKSLVS